MSINAQGSDAVVIKGQTLSRKEQEVKNKLFSKNGNNQPPQQQQKKVTLNTGSAQLIRSNSNASERQQSDRSQEIQVQTDKLIKKQTQQIVIPDQQIESFLKNMEQEFVQANKNQVSMEMLQTQQQILKNNNEILSENQKQLQSIIKKKSDQEAFKQQKQEIMEMNKLYLKDLLQPVNRQIDDIKRMFDESRQQSQQLQEQFNDIKQMSINQPEKATAFQQSLSQNINQFNRSNLVLKEKIGNTQQELTNLLPENVATLNNLQNFNVDIYTNCINNLKQQIEDLQKESDKAEKELEKKYKKLADVPNEIEQLRPLKESLEKNSQMIDFEVYRKNIQIKLGGEFDYDKLQQNVDDMILDVRNVMKEYEIENSEITISIPRVTIDDRDLQNLSIPQSSILEEVKMRLGIDFSQAYAQQQQQQQKQHLQSQDGPQMMQQKQPSKDKSVVPTPQLQQQLSHRSSVTSNQGSVTPGGTGQGKPPLKKGKAGGASASKPLEGPKDIQFVKLGKADEFKTVLGTKKDMEMPQTDFSDIINIQKKQYLSDDGEEDKRKKLDEDQRLVSIQMQGVLPAQKQHAQRKSGRSSNDQSMEVEQKQQQKGKNDQILITYNKDNKINLESCQVLDDVLDTNNKQVLDKDMLKNVITEVLMENKKMLFNQKEEKKDVFMVDQALSPLEQPEIGSSLLNRNKFNRRKKNQEQSEYDPNDPELTNNIAYNFLNIVNNTLSQINYAINKGVNQQMGPGGEQRKEELDPGSVAQSQMFHRTQTQQDVPQQQIFQQQQSLQQQMNPMNQQNPFMMTGGMGGFQPMTMPSMQNFFPNPMGFQQQMPIQQQTMFQPQQMAGNQQQQQQQQQQKGPLNLQDYYKEYMLSESENNQSQYSVDNASSQGGRSQRSQNEISLLKSNYSDATKSDGQISLPPENKSFARSGMSPKRSLNGSQVDIRDMSPLNMQNQQLFSAMNLRTNNQTKRSNEESQELSEGEIKGY